MLLARDFQKTQAEADKLIAKFKALSLSSKALVAGVAVGGMGFALAAGFKAANNEADKFFRLQKDIINNGAKASQTAAITAWAKTDDPRLRSLAITDKMEIGKEAFALTRDAGRDNVEETLKLAPILAQMEAVDKARGVHTSEAQRQSFVKALELSGGFNKGVNTEDHADALYKLMASGNGTLKASTLRALFAADSTDLQNVSGGFLKRAEPLMQEMGSGFGVSMRSFLNRMIAHVGFNGPTGGYQLKLLKQWGVMDKNGDVIDPDNLQHDTDHWIQQHMPEFYKNAGAVTPSQKRKVDQIIGSSGGAKLITAAQRLQPLMEASGRAVDRQHGITQSADEVGGPQAKQNAIMHAQVRDLEERIGETSLPLFVRGLTFLNSMLIRLNAWMAANPGKLRVVVDGLVKFSAALIAIGASSFVLGFLGKLAGLLRFTGSAFMLLARFGGILFTALRFLIIAFMGVVSWPVIIVAGLVAAGIAVYMFRDKIVAAFTGLWGWVKSHLPGWMGGGGGDSKAPAPSSGGGLGSLPAIQSGLKTGLSLPAGAVSNTKVSNDPRVAEADAFFASQGSNVRTAADAKKAGGGGGDVYLDGKKVGKVLEPHLAKSASSQAHGSGFDPTKGLSPAAMNF